MPSARSGLDAGAGGSDRVVGRRAAPVAPGDVQSLVLTTLFSRLACQGLGGGGRSSGCHAESGASPQVSPDAPSSDREQVRAAHAQVGP